MFKPISLFSSQIKQIYSSFNSLTTHNITLLVRKMATQSDTIDVPLVDIDSDGSFKYILIGLKRNEEDTPTYIVRGYNRSFYHKDILEEVNIQVKDRHYIADCYGGGRIEHNTKLKKIHVFGFSVGFGQADHSITVNLLKQKYTDYNDIWFTDDGY